MLDATKENYVLTDEEYIAYVSAAYADLKVPYGI